MGGEGERGNCDNLLLPLLISEDVLIQILVWLPVISLLRFKSVCKSWRAIIESPFFINLHTATTLLPSSFSSKLGFGSSFVFNSSEKHEEEEKRDNIFKLSGEEFEVFEDLGKPPLMDLGEEFEVLRNEYKLFLSIRFSVVGCCNGIICLHDYFTRNIILWNPAIKQSRTLPKPSNLLGNPYCYNKTFLLNNDDEDSHVEDFVMFGIDVKTKDYKVLLLTTLQLPPYYGTGDEDDEYQEKMFMRRRSPRERRAHVYNLSTDSWRCIDSILSADHPYLQINRHVNGGYYLDGSHFFMTSYVIKEQEHFHSYNFMPLIMSFDFTEEIFRTIQPPFDDLREKYSTGCSNHFIPFGEKLALAVDATTDLEADAYMTERSKLEWDVWVLNVQHGVKESWTKFYYTFGNSNSPMEMGLRYIANNGQFAIIHGKHFGLWKFLLLNLITGETKELQSDCPSKDQFDLTVIIYQPSLVQIGRSGAPTNESVTVLYSPFFGFRFQN